MAIGKLSILAAVFFLTSIVSVVTGSTSLITVPVMIAYGIGPHEAVATNMFSLIFMSAGGLAPLWNHRGPQRSQLYVNIALTIVGSVLGALLLTSVPVHALQVAIAIAMIGVAVFSIINRDLGVTRSRSGLPKTRAVLGYSLTFALAILWRIFQRRLCNVADRRLHCSASHDIFGIDRRYEVDERFFRH